jgi:hypothetical protein
MSTRLPNLLVIGGAGCRDKISGDLASAAGHFAALSGTNLLTGGRRGVPEVAAEVFRSSPDRQGRAICILAGEIAGLSDRPSAKKGGSFLHHKGEIADRSLDIALMTHMPGDDPDSAASMNYNDVLSADLVIALAGDARTEAELDMAIALNKPVIALLADEQAIGKYQGNALPRGTGLATNSADLARIASPVLQAFLLPRPSFASLRRVYKTGSADVHRCNISFPNTCAIRMSEALAAVTPNILDSFRTSGLNICPHGYMRGAQDLGAVLRRGDVFGVP